VFSFPTYFKGNTNAAENLLLLYIWDFYDRKAFFYQTADKLFAYCCPFTSMQAMTHQQRQHFTNSVMLGVMLLYNAVAVGVALAVCSSAPGGCL
jgi:hypothetical protein